MGKLKLKPKLLSVKFFDKIKGIPEGTIKSLPVNLAYKIVQEGKGALVEESKQDAHTELKQVKKTSKKTIKKVKK